jgi:SAM-dependent methyltransferase
MPEEGIWASFFNIDLILAELQINSDIKDLVEIGCGYGTFTLPVSKATDNVLFSFDMDTLMIQTTQLKVEKAGIINVKLLQKDVLEGGTGFEEESAGMILLFNILHSEERKQFLEEANRILKQGGIVAIIHWRKDIITPRGPDISLRPDLQIILDISSHLNFRFYGNSRILEPFHWGMQLIKK